MKTLFSSAVIATTLALSSLSYADESMLSTIKLAPQTTDTSCQLWSETYSTPDSTTPISATFDEMKSMYPYALMSYFAEMHKVSSSKSAKQEALQDRIDKLEAAGYHSFVSKSELPEKWQKSFKDTVRHQYDSSKTALKARFYKNDLNNTITMAIAGTAFNSPTSIASAIQLSLGYVSGTAQEALALAKDLQKEYPTYRIVLTGASQGGAISQYVVSKTKGTSAIVFNSQGLHPTMISNLTDDNVTHLYVEGESMSEGSYHLAGTLIQNSLPVQGKMIPANDVLSSIIINHYYDALGGKTLTGWMAYRTTTTSFAHHWTGAILIALEHYNNYQMTSLYQ